jgi:hypothetical protein
MGDKITQRNVFGRNSVVSRVVTLKRGGEKQGFIKGVSATVVGGLIVGVVLKLIGA